MYYLSYFKEQIMIYALAPMDWVTDTVYRQIVKKVFDKYNKHPDRELWLFTEFMSSDGFFHNPDWVIWHLEHSEYEDPLIAQIYGSDEEKLLHTLKFVNKNYDFYWIELNIWCPSPKVMRLGWWSALMKQKKRTCEIVQKLSESSTKPFSIKTRVWLNIDDKEERKESIINFSKYCHLVSVHGRTMSSWHSWDADLDYVLDLKWKVDPSCKIVFNWWVGKESLQDPYFQEQISNLDGIMIWQAAIWNPWVFVDHKPCMEERRQTMTEHLKLNILHKWENRGMIEFRKFIWNYIKWIDNASKFRLELMHSSSLERFLEVLSKI